MRITRNGVDVSLFLAMEKAFSRSSVRAARFAGIGFQMVHTGAAVRAWEGSSFSDFGIGMGRALTFTKIIAV